LNSATEGVEAGARSGTVLQDATATATVTRHVFKIKEALWIMKTQYHIEIMNLDHGLAEIFHNLSISRYWLMILINATMFNSRRKFVFS
jgi:hypothetical protein